MLRAEFTHLTAPKEEGIKSWDQVEELVWRSKVTTNPSSSSLPCWCALYLTAERFHDHILPSGRAVWRKPVNGSITIQPANLPGCDHRRARSPDPDDGGAAVMTSMPQECLQLSPSAIFPSSSRSVAVNPPLQSAAMKACLRSLFGQPGNLLDSVLVLPAAGWTF